MSKVGNVISSASSLQTVEKLRAEKRLDYYRHYYDFSINQLAANSKWLSATLFAANAGGLLTLINQATKISFLLASGIAFTIGLILALLGAVAVQEFYSRLCEPLTSMIDYWSEVSIVGTTNEVEFDKISSKFKEIGKYGWIAPTCGWVSGLAFIIGVSIVAYGLAPITPP